jgi:outer membrane protein assembly factor BamB
MKTDRAVHWGLGIGAVMIAAALAWQSYAPGRAPRSPYPAIPEKWEYTAGGNITGALALAADGTLYAANSDGFVYALDSEGNLKWKLKTGPMVASPVIGADGTIYVADEQERIYAINPNGTQQWQTGGGPYATQNLGKLAAAIDNNFLYTPWRRQVHGIRLTNGDGEATFGANFDAGSSISILPSGLVVHAGRGRLEAVGADGKTAWQYPELTQEAIEKNNGFPPPGNFWLDSAMAVGADGTIYGAMGDGSFVAIGADGTLKWKFKTTQGWAGNHAAPVISSDGTIYFSSWAAILYAFSPDGTQKATIQIPGSIEVTPVISGDGTIFVLSGAALLAISPDGKVTEESQIGVGVTSAPTIGTDGTLYVATISGKILAFDGGHGGLMDSPWPKFQRDLANSGRAAPY